MSRIGRNPITIPAGVTVTVANGVVSVKGPLGELKQEIASNAILVEVKDGHIVVTRTSEEKDVRAKHGLYRAILQNNVIGVTTGYTKELKLTGVGYKVEKKGKAIVMKVGFSHEVVIDEPAGITLECPAATEIVVKGINKVAVGQCAANIRSIRKPEPYHGYGIMYKNEIIERKEGKTAGK